MSKEGGIGAKQHRRVCDSNRIYKGKYPMSLPITVMAVSGMIEKSVAHNPEWITGLGEGIHLLILYEIRTKQQLLLFFCALYDHIA